MNHILKGKGPTDFAFCSLKVIQSQEGSLRSLGEWTPEITLLVGMSPGQKRKLFSLRERGGFFSKRKLLESKHYVLLTVGFPLS